MVTIFRRTKSIVATLFVTGLSFGIAGPAAPAGVNSAGAHQWGALFAESGKQDVILSPSAVDLPAAAVQVASSNSTEYALLANGSVWAWGLGGDGQLGDGATTDSLQKAVEVKFPAGVKISFLPVDAMPFDTGLAVDSKGRAWGWGKGSLSLCLGKVKTELAPVQLPLVGVTALAGAGDHTVFDANGTVYACGGNGYGDLGDGTNVSSGSPVEVQGLSGVGVRTLVASYRNSGALLDNGTYLDWGYDAGGQLGDGTINVASAVPVTVNLPLPVTQVALGGSDITNGETLVMLSDGTLRSWGDDGSGQLGDGRTTDEASPVQFFPPAGVTYQTLAAGGTTSYAISTTGEVFSFGGGTLGQIGNNDNKDVPDPTPVESGASLISATADDVVTN